MTLILFLYTCDLYFFYNGAQMRKKRRKKRKKGSGRKQSGKSESENMIPNTTYCGSKNRDNAALRMNRRIVYRRI